MLTDSYIKKISPFLKIYKFAYRFRYLLMVSAFVLSSTGITLASIDGLIYKDIEVNDIEYGDNLFLNAKGIFNSDIRYEYKESGDEEWTNVEPFYAGDYEVRAVSRNIFGQDIKGNVHNFKILPKKIKPKVKETHFVYGNNPIFTFDLVDEDKIATRGYHYNNLSTEPKLAFDESDFKFVNKEGKDVSANYEVDLSDIPVVLDARPIQIETHDNKVYDGKPLRAGTNYKITSGSLFRNDHVVVKKANSITNAVEVAPDLELGFETDHNDDISHLYNSSLSSNSDFSISKRPLEITFDDYEKVYDGYAMPDPTFRITNGSILDNNHIEMEFNNYIDAGEYEANFYSVRILDENNEDVTSNYDWSIIPGKIKINKRPLEITTASNVFTYDGEDKTLPEYSITQGKVCDGDKLVLVGESTFNKKIGTYENRLEFDILNENEVSNLKNYDLTTIYGKVEIVKRPITIQTKDVIKTYDGLTYMNGIDDLIYNPLDLGNGDVITIETNKEFEQIAGITQKNELTITIRNQLGESVNDCYDINYDYGDIIINKVPISFKTYDQYYTYSKGKQHSTGNLTITNGKLVNGDYYNATNQKFYEEIGKYQNYCIPKISNSYGKDVTGNYDIDITYGILEIKPDPNIVEGETPQDPSLPPQDIENPNKPETPRPEDEFDKIPDLSKPEKPNPEPGEGGQEQNPGGGDETNPPVKPDSEKYLFTLKANEPGAIYLRQNVFSGYSKGKLYSAKEYQVPGDFQNPNNYVGNLFKDKSQVKPIQINTFNHNIRNGLMPYYTNQIYSSSDISTYNYEILNYDLRDYEYLEDRLNPLNPDYFSWNNGFENYESFVYNKNLWMEISTRNAVNTLIEQYKLDDDNDFDKILKVGKFLYRYYGIGLNPYYEPGTDIISEFLLNTKNGSSEHFATAAAMLLRGLNIPSRIASGFKFFAKNPGDIFKVEKTTGKPFYFTTWTEVYIKEIHSWVKMDFTPGSNVNYDKIEQITPDPVPEPEPQPEPTPDPKPEPEIPEREPVTEYISIYGDSTVFTYNGNPHVYEQYSSYGNPRKGDRMEINFKTEHTDVGKRSNRYEVKFYEIATGKDVTSDYRNHLSSFFGFVTINKAYLNANGRDINVAFEGAPLKGTIDDVDFDGLASTDKVTKCEFLFTLNKKGTIKVNRFTVQEISRDNYKQAKLNYNIYYNYGKMTAY